MLSDGYPCARVSVIFRVFLHLFVLAKLATSSIRVNISSRVWLHKTYKGYDCLDISSNRAGYDRFGFNRSGFLFVQVSIEMAMMRRATTGRGTTGTALTVVAFSLYRFQ